MEQAPFAIEDLMNEMGAEDTSESDEEERDELSEKPSRGEDDRASHMTRPPALQYLPWFEPAALPLGPVVCALAPSLSLRSKPMPLTPSSHSAASVLIHPAPP